MRNVVRTTVCLLVLFAAMMATYTARAGEKEEARKHYDRAIGLVDDGQLPEAIIEFQRSYDLTKNYSVLYNLGQVFVSLAKPVEAIDAYQRYLAEGGKKIPTARRAEVEREIALQKARVATLNFHILPDGATIRVDGSEVGKAPTIESLVVGIGEHVVSATAEGHEPAEVKVTVAGEDRRVVELTLAPLPEKKVEPEPAPVTAIAPPIASPAPLAVKPPLPEAAAPPTLEMTVPIVTEHPADGPSLNHLQVSGIVSGAAGVAGLATAIVCWVVAQSRHDQAVTAWKQGDNDSRALTLQGQAQDYVTASNISAIGGGVLLAAGVTLYVVGLQDTQATKNDSHAHLMPMLGPSLAGLNLGGAF